MKIAFISDIHEDKIRLEKALRLIEKEHCEEIICLGDIVGFNIPAFEYLNFRNASACIRLVRENCSAVVKGNHDLYAIQEFQHKPSIFNYPGNWYQLDFHKRKKLAKGKLWLYEDNELSALLSDSDKDYIKSLPLFIIKQIDRIKFLFTHFHYPDFSGSLIGFPDTYRDLKSHFRFMEKQHCSMSFSGHGHTQGSLVATKKSFYFNVFKDVEVTPDLCWISGPAIAISNRENGFMLFNTNTYELKTLSLV